MAFPHQARIDWAEFEQAAPGVVQAMRALTQAVDGSGLDKQLTELLKIRASQLNGCAFCLQFHLNLARKLQVVPAKIDLVATWAEVPGLFTERECAALAWTEALTLMGGHLSTGAAYAELQLQFTPAEIANLTAAIAAINAWNRMAGGLSFTPPVPASQLSA